MIGDVLNLYQSAIVGRLELAEAQDVLLTLGKEIDRCIVKGRAHEDLDTLYDAVLSLIASR